LSVSAVEVIGWAGTVSGTILGLPQALRLVRTRRVDGLSLTAGRAMLVVNLIWTAHGISIGQLPQIVTSALSLCWRSSRRSRLTRLAALTLVVLLGGGSASTDLAPSAGTDPVTPASTVTASATPTIRRPP
jgi:uncharacterized protein with PQ loop repeat